ncbi:MAG: hypothetical protein WC455_15335 [Dehalococcoidia bacterium]|jgi:hypothetical protein
MWNRIEDSLFDDPKLQSVCVSLNLDDSTVIGMLVKLWGKAMVYASDGVLSAYDTKVWVKWAGWNGDAEGFKAALMDAGKPKKKGFIEELDGEIVLHNWQKYGGYQLEQMDKKAQNQKEYRERQSKQTKKPPETAEELLGLFNAEELVDLQANHPGVALKEQAERCLTWWKESNKKMVRPKTAYLNWLEKAKPSLPVAQSKPAIPHTVKCELRNE